MTPGARNFIAAIAAFSALSFIAVQSPGQQKQAIGSAGSENGGFEGTDVTEGQGEDPATGLDPTNPSIGPTSGTGPGAALPSKFQCAAGRNGGATDKGISATKIKLASTHVQSGIGASFLGASNVGMRAVVSQVNSTGGICGRLVDLTLRDDGWDAARGASFIQNFINGDYFALPVVPSSEGLTAAIKNGSIDRAGIPVVGTDGMLKEQYQSPNVWPVATATVSTMRIMAKHAFEKLGARSFGIVYDSQYKFGREGADAFKSYVSKLSGAKLKAFVGIQPGQPSYPQTTTFNSQCGGYCDFVAMLLEPGTANTWIQSQGNDEASGRKLGFGSKGTGGAQPLFNEQFAKNCRDACSGMMLWTGYVPAIGALQNLPGVARYKNDTRKIDPGVDFSNQFLEGAYLGMQVFVDALRKTGPELTRARFKAVMDGFTMQTDLAAPLTWAKGRHYANVSAQAFSIVTAAGGFNGFRDARTGFIKDPEPGNFG